MAVFAWAIRVAHFMSPEIGTPLNNDFYTEYADGFSFLFRLYYKVIWVYKCQYVYVYRMASQTVGVFFLF